MATEKLKEAIKEMMVKNLMLKTPGEMIPDDLPLFGPEGLGLDSIDALELGVAIRKTYGMKIETVSDEVRAHFATVRALAAFIRDNGGKTP